MGELKENKNDSGAKKREQFLLLKPKRGLCVRLRHYRVHKFSEGGNVLFLQEKPCTGVFPFQCIARTCGIAFDV